jgi:hypothetical protein
MKKLFYSSIAIFSLAASSFAFSEMQPGECYDIGAKFGEERAGFLCSGRLPYNGVRVSRACKRAAISGCKDTLIRGIKSLQNSGDCPNFDASSLSTLSSGLLKNRECNKILDVVGD